MESKIANCWNIKGCPASFYHNCNAYAKKIDCWKIKDGCQCNHHSDCNDCSIFIDYKKNKASTN